MHKDHVDEHAETWVLPPQDLPLRAELIETDPLALYEEYLRTLVGEPVPPVGTWASSRD